jgi:hypothetical protein
MEAPNTYTTGKPCIRGHIAARRRDSGACTDCAREKRGLKPLGKQAQVNPLKILDREFNARKRFIARLRAAIDRFEAASNADYFKRTCAAINVRKP